MELDRWYCFRCRLLRMQSYTEREIAGYIRQLLRGVKYMHDNSVAHLGLTVSLFNKIVFQRLDKCFLLL